MNNINAVDKNKCCGCGACYNKCQVGAIFMQENEEGFLIPVIDESKCTNCGLCKKACPSLEAKYTNSNEPDCYATIANDDLRANSSSGGTFSLLAENILNKGGYVCGAAFDKNWEIRHLIIDNKEELAKLRGSKYVQSNTEKCYSQIKSLLEDNKLVLFSGCPCQVAGLYSFLGKNYKNLYTVDILCHGAPSPGAWRKYLQENFDISEIKNLNFRDKSKIGWSCSHLTITKNNSEQIVSEKYTKLFHQAITMRTSCQDCTHSKLPRPADITIGDFWGIFEYNPSLNDSKGTSFVLLNNTKGETLFKEIECQKHLINLNQNYNNGHIRFGLKLNPERKRFFKNLKNFGFNIARKIILENKYDISLLTTFYANNYGAILVAYSVYELINSLKYTVNIIQPTFHWQVLHNKECNKIPLEFAEKHYDITKICSNKDLAKLNSISDNFIVGSDQMFNPGLNIWFAFLNFAKLNKNKIAFATSFGDDNFKYSEQDIQQNKYLLNRFNHIALREVSEPLNKMFNINPAELIDPTLMLTVEKYEELIKESKVQIDEPYLLTYTLDLNEEKATSIKYIANKLNLKIINIGNLSQRQINEHPDIEYEKDVTPEDFLKLYKNASFVFSDSYHGTCFSVKFNKPFISMINKNRGSLRYKLFDKLLLSHRLVNDFTDIENNDKLFAQIDYTNINPIIEKETKFAISWLDNAIKNNNFDENFSTFDLIVENRLSEFENEIERSKIQILELKKDFSILANKNKILISYYRYKTMSKCLIGNKRKYYKEKAKMLHDKVRKIRLLANGVTDG